ncbi:MAG: BACON domain-containing carbohydrate-binding protein [bacterium]
MKKIILIYALLVNLYLFADCAAQPITIEVRTEGYGTIYKTTGDTNFNGAAVWNGQDWIVNSTWAHKYFIVVESGNRLKDINYVDLRNINSSVIDTLNYNIICIPYEYFHEAKNGGKYYYNALEYIIEDKTTLLKTVLRSQGNGNGINSSYFNIYIEDDVDLSLKPYQITAIRNDPQWFTYSNMSMEEVLIQSSLSDSLTGSFPTTNGWYFLDIGGGGDLGPAGIGKSYIFHTDSLTGKSNINDLESSYPIDFGLRFMDTHGDVHELDFLPKLLCETYIPTDTINSAGSSGGTIKFQVKTVLSWTAESDQPWLTIDPTSGTGDAEITITAEPNTTPNERTAHVTITIGGTAVQTIAITQPGATVGIEDDLMKPGTFELYQNYPNPFNPTTKIKFTIASVETPYMASLQHVTLEIYDVLGREVATLVDEVKPAGYYEVTFDAKSLPSGIYFYNLTAGSFSQTKKLIFLK